MTDQVSAPDEVGLCLGQKVWTAQSTSGNTVLCGRWDDC